jgi:hypothetical protein
MVERKDVEAALETRRELGAAYEPEIVDAMVEKIEKRLDERLHERSLPARSQHGDSRILLGSIALGIPVTAVALSNAPGAGGVIVAIIAWIAIANITYYGAGRRGR